MTVVEFNARSDDFFFTAFILARRPNLNLISCILSVFPKIQPPHSCFFWVATEQCWFKWWHFSARPRIVVFSCTAASSWGQNIVKFADLRLAILHNNKSKHSAPKQTWCHWSTLGNQDYCNLVGYTERTGWYDTTRMIWYSLVKHKVNQEITVLVGHVYICRMKVYAVTWESAKTGWSQQWNCRHIPGFVSHVRFHDVNKKLSKYLQRLLQVWLIVHNI